MKTLTGCGASVDNRMMIGEQYLSIKGHIRTHKSDLWRSFLQKCTMKKIYTFLGCGWYIIGGLVSCREVLNHNNELLICFQFHDLL